jgi:Na+/H+ antiporter NhaC
MDQTYGWLSLLPPLLAILLAIRTKQVFLSLFLGIWIGWTVIGGWNPLVGFARALDACVNVFADAGNTRVILFSAMVGAVLTFTQRSGGVEGFVQWVGARGLTRSRTRAALFSWMLGVVLFIESSITILVTGAISRPVFDKLRISREKLAYILDSTSAPVCILIPLNAWGAYVVTLLTNESISNPVAVFTYAVPLNFYAIAAVLLVLSVILTGKDFGPMRAAEKRAREEGKVLEDDAEPLVSTEIVELPVKDGVRPQARNMVIPVAVMVLMMPLGLLITGKGDLLAGSGSTSVFWAILAAIVTAGLLYKAQNLFSLSEQVDLFFKGVGGLMPMAILLVLAFAIGATCRELGTGLYVANIAKRFISPNVVPVAIFLVSAFIAFSTGTSFGTFGIMIPIAVPMAASMDASLSASVGAVLGGGVFGDHCSPISDTTIISSMGSASDHIDHVRTQLPYALTAAGIALLGYIVTGLA